MEWESEYAVLYRKLVLKLPARPLDKKNHFW